jgi:predicted flap endonuclease-1-like 5' DNA nuclease
MHGKPPARAAEPAPRPVVQAAEAPVVVVAEPIAAPAPAVAAEPAPAPEAAPAPKSGRTRANPVVDAPAIGEKLAARLNAIGVMTIGDLLDRGADDIAQALDFSLADASVVASWQTMTRLSLDVATVGEQDAQILFACGVHDRTALAQCDAKALQDTLAAFVASNEGRKLLRGNGGPKPEKVERWIEAARNAAA